MVIGVSCSNEGFNGTESGNSSTAPNQSGPSFQGIDAAELKPVVERIVNEGEMPADLLDSFDSEDPKFIRLIALLARQDVGLALKVISQVENSLVGHYLFDAVFAENTAASVEDKFESIQAYFSGGNVSLAVTSLIEADGKRDGAAIGEQVLELSPGGYRSDLIATLAQEWGRSDISAAIAWFDENLSLPKEQRMALRGVINATPQMPLDELIAQFEKVSHEPVKEALANAIGSTYAGAPNDFANSLRQLVADYDGHDAVKDVVDGFIFSAQSHPKELQALVSDGHIPEANRDLAFEIVASGRLALTDPRGVMDWLASVDSGTTSGAFSVAYDNWIHRESIPATEWATKLESGPAKSTVASLTVDFLLGKKEFGDAAVWAGAISTSEQFAKKAEKIAKKWAKNDRDGAMSWVSKVQPAELQNSLLEMLLEEP